MGQYHKIVSFTRAEYINPHAFADGLKQLEFATSGQGTMMALAYLLSHPESRGGGDFTQGTFKGRWKGNEIAIIGDYAEESDNNKYDEKVRYNPFNENNILTDISTDVICDMIDNDTWMAEIFKEQLESRDFYWNQSHREKDANRIRKSIQKRLS